MYEKLTSRGWILNIGVFYLMKVLVRYFVDKPFFVVKMSQRGQ